jgi:soluble lytic murein transglycosylase-like protein
MDLVFARSRRRAAARRTEPAAQNTANWRLIRTVLLALAMFALVGESTKLAISNARSSTKQKPGARASVCGLPAAFGDAFRAAAKRTGLPLPLLVSIAYEESRMDPNALSGAGARGLLQLMPATAREVARGDSPNGNVLGGALYLRQLMRRFHGDLDLALAAYNAGPTAVAKRGGAPSTLTLTYVRNIEARAARLAACR